MSSTARPVPSASIDLDPDRELDLRLVVADMDGTLLDGNGLIPGSFWPLLDQLHERGIVFVPASGRQYATLAKLFDRAPSDTSFIAENGSYVVRNGVEVASTTLRRAVVEEVVRHLRTMTQLDLGVVLCGKRSAYVERKDEAFVGEARKYYAALEVVDDLLAPDDEVLKIAVFDFGDAETGAGPGLARFGQTEQVVVSNHHWVDVMAA